jgi:hypothetical protein
VVTVVALDDRGTPTCQGLGVVISQGGYILTSAAIFAQTPHGVVKTAAGSLHVIRDLVRRDDLQDLALVQVEADNFTVPPVRVAPRLASQEEVAAPETRPPGTLHKGRVAKTLPLSPRLVLVKLEPESLTGPPGTPLFNRRGELAGMLHTFAPDPAAAPGLLVWLAHSRTHTWREPELTAGPMPPPIRGCADFWAGVTASLRQEWPVSRDKFSAALAAGWPAIIWGMIPGPRRTLPRRPGASPVMPWRICGWARPGTGNASLRRPGRPMSGPQPQIRIWPRPGFTWGCWLFRQGA